jgi:hypothetical protein
LNFDEYAVVIEEEETKDMFLSNKFVRAANMSKKHVSFSHFFSSRGAGAKYEDLSTVSAEELSVRQGDVFMTNVKNEFFHVFNDLADFVQSVFHDELRTSTCASVSVMKLTNVDVHCDDDAVGDRIVIVNCSDDEYDLLFYEHVNKDVYLGKLTVKPWMIYLLAGHFRLAYHEVRNANKYRTVVRLGFLEVSSIHEYLAANPAIEYTQAEKKACSLDGRYKRVLKELKSNSDNFFGPNITSRDSILGKSDFLERTPQNSRHGFLYFNPDHVRHIFGNSPTYNLLNQARISVIQLVKDNRTSIRPWSYDSALKNYSWALVVHFKGLAPSQTVCDINETITAGEESKRRSQILNLDLKENHKHRNVFKAMAKVVYDFAIPDYVKESVDFPNVLFDININLFSAVFTPPHKDEALNQAPGVIVVNVYLSKKGSLVVFKNQFTNESVHRRIEGEGMHIFFADLYTVYDHGVFSSETLSSDGLLIPLNIENLDASRIVLTFRYGYSKLRDRILQRMAFYLDKFDFHNEPSDVMKKKASANADNFLWNAVAATSSSTPALSAPSSPVEDEDDASVDVDDVTMSVLPISSVSSSSSVENDADVLILSPSSSVENDGDVLTSSEFLRGMKGWNIEYWERSFLSSNLFRVQRASRSTNSSQFLSDGDIFGVVDNGVQKEICILAILRLISKPNRMLALCTTRVVGDPWDNDYFMSNAVRFLDDQVNRKPKTTDVPLTVDEVNNLLNQYKNQTEFKETLRTSQMWNSIIKKVSIKRK